MVDFIYVINIYVNNLLDFVFPAPEKQAAIHIPQVLAGVIHRHFDEPCIL